MNKINVGSNQVLEVGLNLCTMASWKGWEANERNEYGAISISYKVGGTFVSEFLSIPNWIPADEYEKKKNTAFTQNIFKHLHALGVSAESFNSFVDEHFALGIPSEQVATPEGLATTLEALIPSKEVEGSLLVHLGGNNKHYVYQSGVGVFVTYKDESFEELITLYNQDKLPEHVRTWGQSWICPFFTTMVKVDQVKIGIKDYKNPTEEPEMKDWTLITEVNGDATYYYYTDRFNWNPKVDQVSASFDEPQEDLDAEAKAVEEIFGLK